MRLRTEPTLLKQRVFKTILRNLRYETSDNFSVQFIKAEINF